MGYQNGTCPCKQSFSRRDYKPRSTWISFLLDGYQVTMVVMYHSGDQGGEYEDSGNQ